MDYKFFPWSIESLSKEERASTFLDNPVIGKLPGFFSLLTVEISRAISSSRVTGLFTFEACIRASREKINKRVVYIISRAEVTLILNTTAQLLRAGAVCTQQG